MGRLVRGRYDILDVVGRGGEGEVLRATDRVGDLQVALKVRYGVRSEDEREDAVRAARLLRSVRPQRGVAVVLDDFFDADTYYLVMEWVEGRSLARLLETQPDGLDAEVAMKYLVQAADALDHLHSHEPPVLHLDVKPSNFVVTSDGRLVLVDFGTARRLSAAQQPHKATPGYMAPELASGAAPTRAADIFSLAATAHTLLTGRPPRPGSTKEWAGMPPGRARRMREALAVGLAFEPDCRPRSAHALVAMLEAPPSPTNIAAPRSSFVGRQRELLDVKARLRDERLVTLAGPGGCGKTRLAIEVARHTAWRYPDGTWIVDLAPLSDQSLVPQAAAAALGLSEQPGTSLLWSLAERVRNRHLLVIIDNCEHLLEAAAKLADALLNSTGDVRVLATSREPLGVPGERVCRVGSLSVPELGASHADALASDSVRLLYARANATAERQLLIEGSAPLLVSICRQLDGIPLALEMAAARLGEVSLADLNEDLGAHTSGLRGDGGAPPRQRSLAAALRWSYLLLSAPERTVFRQLGVFAGGFSRTAAEAVCVAAPCPSDISVHLERLVDKSLVVTTHSRGPEMRYRLLEPVRQFALEQLAHDDEPGAVPDRHLTWFLAVAREAEKTLEGSDSLPLDHLEEDQDNLRQALSWALASGNAAAALEMAVALPKFWRVRGSLEEGCNWIEQALEEGRAADAQLRLRALHWLRAMRFYQGDFREARRLAEECLALATAMGDRSGAAEALAAVGNLASRQGDFEHGRAYLEESVAAWTEAASGGAVKSLVDSLMLLGWLWLDQGDLARARPLLEQSLAQADSADKPMRVFVRCLLADLERAERNLARARMLLDESLLIAQDLGFTRYTAYLLTCMGRLERSEGRATEAFLIQADALTMHHQVGNRHGSAWALEELGKGAADAGDFETAASLFGAAEALRETIGFPLPPAERPDLAVSTSMTARALGDEAMAVAWGRGRTAPLSDSVRVVAMACDSYAPDASFAHTPPSPTRPR